MEYGALTVWEMKPYTLMTILKPGDTMLTIYTTQIAHASKTGLDKDPAYLDITVKSGDRTFAPTWKMMMSYKDGCITETQYTDQYMNLMRRSYVENRARWEEVLNLEKVVLSCYCRPEAFCHRYILTDIFVKLGAEYMEELR